PMDGSSYYDPIDIKGLGKVIAWSTKSGYQDSEKTEYDVRYYADDNHAETSGGGLLEKTFDWDSTLPKRVETFRIEGLLNDSDYRYILTMDSLRYLDIEKVNDAHIPEGAFQDSKLISISLPSDLAEYGNGIFSGASCLSSVKWNSRTQNMDNRVTDCLANPNALVYVPSDIDVAQYHALNVVTDGRATSVILNYGFPYYAAWDVRADNVSMTREFRQETGIGVCQGWETVVLPFSPTLITHEMNGETTPFAAWDGDTQGKKPFWLYTSTTEGWEKASEIEACVPYIISMPNNSDYVDNFNLAGRITFSASDVDLGPDSSVAISTPWMERTEFEGTFMPVAEKAILTLNVADNLGEYLPGSTFVPNDYAIPFSAYVKDSIGKKAMPVFGDWNGVITPTLSDDGLAVETPAPGVLSVSTSRERKVTVTTTTGVVIRTLHLNAGETAVLDGFTRDIYIVGGVKVIVR
ncbi:MAG: leucine-rich repeat domain-containing protein, partial [Muribaculaceae bacterium]|nr:leucine-rich repeat domain-containing protein [Muribaculaceae bacterium]